MPEEYELCWREDFGGHGEYIPPCYHYMLMYDLVRAQVGVLKSFRAKNTIRASIHWGNESIGEHIKQNTYEFKNEAEIIKFTEEAKTWRISEMKSILKQIQNDLDKKIQENLKYMNSEIK